MLNPLGISPASASVIPSRLPTRARLSTQISSRKFYLLSQTGQRSGPVHSRYDGAAGVRGQQLL